MMEVKIVNVTVNKAANRREVSTRRKGTKSMKKGKGMTLAKTLAVVIAAMWFIHPLTASDDSNVDFMRDTIGSMEYTEYARGERRYARNINTTISENDDDLTGLEPVLPEPEHPSYEIVESLEVPQSDAANKGVKTFMGYTSIKSKASKQYQMQQEDCTWTDEEGFRRYGDYYMVALGTFYAQSAGETFLVTLDTGVTFKAITGDIKSDKHTDSRHQHRNGNIVEFIVDTAAIPQRCKVMGDMSYAADFSGKIARIDRIADNSAV